MIHRYRIGGHIATSPDRETMGREAGERWRDTTGETEGGSPPAAPDRPLFVPVVPQRHPVMWTITIRSIRSIRTNLSQQERPPHMKSQPMAFSSIQTPIVNIVPRIGIEPNDGQ